MTEDKTKVKDLATELGVPTKNLLQALRELDIPAKSTSSNIAAEDIDRVKNHLKDSATSEQGDRRGSPASLSVAAASPPRTLRPKAKKRPARNAGPRVKTTPTARIVSVPGASGHRTPRLSPLRNPKRRPLRKFPCRNRKDAAEEKPAWLPKPTRPTTRSRASRATTGRKALRAA
ncbi:MAG: translation initiation factor IF-2 N-terminal domain-containing protein [Bilophila wadsworthia]